jgi:hypothetical protein
MTRIITEFDPKPIPDRSFDWVAIQSSYDGMRGSPVGYGKTEAEAVADLRERLADGSKPRRSYRDWRCPTCGA